jgi:hypothetical protein
VSVRAMLARVQRLEQARTSPWDHLIGPIEEFDAYIRDGIAVGQLDPRDAPVVLASVRRWVREAL